MAITFITGVARSGKSYYSTHYIYQMYKNHLKKINVFMQWFRYYILPLAPVEYYQTTFTNINQFNFDFHPRLKPLVFSELIPKLEILYDLRVNQNKQDDEMIIESKKLGLHNALFIIDEGAHYFTKPVDKVIIWWLTYHGHLFQDIHILSQHMDQIPSEYTKNGEYFYMAYPPSNAIFKNKITYGLYANGKFYKNGKKEDFSIPLIPQVYELYVSGKLPKRKPVLKKFIPIFIFLVFALSWSLYSVFSSGDIQKQIVTSDNNTTLIEDDISEEIIPINDEKSKEEDFELEGYKLVNIKCINEVCKYNNKGFPIDFLLHIIKNNTFQYSSINKISHQHIEYTFLFNDEIVSFFEKSFKSKESSKKKSERSTTPQIKLFGD